MSYSICHAMFRLVVSFTSKPLQTVLYFFLYNVRIIDVVCVEQNNASAFIHLLERDESNLNVIANVS